MTNDDSVHTHDAVVWHPPTIMRADRWQRMGVHGGTVWLTGLSGSGKSSVAYALSELLHAAGRPHVVLDGDNLRHGLNADLGFAAGDRTENVRRVGEVARLFAEAGLVAIVPVISPYRADRERVRVQHERDGLLFIEVWVDTPLVECARRDPKGLYASAAAGELSGLTGVDAPYEAPTEPEVLLTPDAGGPPQLAALVLAELERRERGISRGQP